MAPELPIFNDGVHPKTEDLSRSFDYTKLVERSLDRTMSSGVLYGLFFSGAYQGTVTLNPGAAVAEDGSIIEILAGEVIVNSATTSGGFWFTGNVSTEIWLYNSSSTTVATATDIAGASHISATKEVFSLFFGTSVTVGFPTTTKKVRLATFPSAIGTSLLTPPTNSVPTVNNLAYNYAIAGLTHTGRVSTEGYFTGTRLIGSQSLMPYSVDSLRLSIIPAGYKNYNPLISPYPVTDPLYTLPNPTYPYTQEDPPEYSVDTDNIRNHSIIFAKMSRKALNGAPADPHGAAVGQANIMDGAVGVNEIAAGAVTQSGCGVGFNLLPAGIILPWAGVNTDISIMPGFRFCNGDLIFSHIYPALWAAIGHTWTWLPSDRAYVAYNVLYNGVTYPTSHTFRVPDLRGRFLRGAQMSRTTGGDPSYTSRIKINSDIESNTNGGTLETGEIQTHTHGISNWDIYFAGRYNDFVGANRSSPAISSPVQPHSVENYNGVETRPTNISVPYIISTGSVVVTGTDNTHLTSNGNDAGRVSLGY